MSSQQIGTEDTLPGNYECLVQVKAQVMTRDDIIGMWVPLNRGGMSIVGLYRTTPGSSPVHRDCDGATAGTVQQGQRFLISGHRMSDDVVVLHCVLSAGFQYIKVNPTFHRWSVDDKPYGLTFQTFSDATAFERSINQVMETLKTSTAAAAAAAAPVPARRLALVPKNTNVVWNAISANDVPAKENKAKPSVEERPQLPLKQNRQTTLEASTERPRCGALLWEPTSERTKYGAIATDVSAAMCRNLRSSEGSRYGSHLRHDSPSDSSKCGPAVHDVTSERSVFGAPIHDLSPERQRKTYSVDRMQPQAENLYTSGCPSDVVPKEDFSTGCRSSLPPPLIRRSPPSACSTSPFALQLQHKHSIRPLGRSGGLLYSNSSGGGAPFSSSDSQRLSDGGGAQLEEIPKKKKVPTATLR